MAHERHPATPATGGPQSQATCAAYARAGAALPAGARSRPRTARLIALAGAAGVVVVVVGSLVGHRPATIAVDTLLHLLGYAVLAALFVLALRPRAICRRCLAWRHSAL